MKFIPHDYQTRAVRWIEDHPRCLLFLDMGLGKTVSTLTAVRNLQMSGEVSRVLVIAPKKVAEGTWSSECLKWDHLSHLKVSTAVGSQSDRVGAFDMDADVYVMGRDSLVWFMEQKRRPAFDMVVVDELTGFKNHRSQRHKALRKLCKDVPRVVGLTGTPTPNGLIDLFGQVACVDGGERLGRYLTHFRDRWFNVRLINNIPISVTPKPGAQEEIMALISDISLTMSASDYLSLPPMVEHDVPVILPAQSMRGYAKFQKDLVMELDKSQVTAASAASLSNKLAQYANGALYDDTGVVKELHDAKLEALGEILESTNGPVLCFYQYLHDLDRIVRKFKATAYEGPEQLEAWNAGKIRLLCAHPASTAYGLNMQSGGHTVVWFSTGWNLEHYQQANARLHRQGQTRPVTVFRLIATGTIDERMAAAVARKSSSQAGFISQMKKLLKQMTL